MIADKYRQYLSNFHRPFLAVIATLLVCVVTMSVYLRTELDGNIDVHFLPGEMFGVPQGLAARGLGTYYAIGWDGQFYYYMANDILATTDTPEHVDAPAYRWQRVGLSLYTKVVSLVLGQSWVSPTLYYLSYLLLILAGTFAGGLLYRQSGASGAWALLWSLGAGTQVTLLNGLPDAAADAFLILALLALHARQIGLGMLAMAFATLCREAYVIFPLCLVFFSALPRLLQPSSGADTLWYRAKAAVLDRDVLWPVVPVLVFIGWQAYVRVHFGVSPSSLAVGIVGPPFVALYEALSSAIANLDGYSSASEVAARELMNLLIFQAIVLLTLIVSVRALIQLSASVVARSVALATIVLALLYLCFGQAVMVHYTGYMKAASLFFFTTPYLVSQSTFAPTWCRAAGVLIAVMVLFSAYGLWIDRVAVNTHTAQTRYTRAFEVRNTGPLPCLKNYDAQVSINPVHLEMHAPRSILRSLLGAKEKFVLHVTITNRGKEPFGATVDVGTVNVSYRWFDAAGAAVVKDGVRSTMPRGLNPGESADVPIVVEFPENPGRYTLRVSPVQEGCLWFHEANPSSKADLTFQLD